MRRTRRRRYALIMVMVVATVIGVVAPAGDAQAVVRSPLNSPEVRAKSLCNSRDRRGAIWISGTSSTAANASGYYNAKVSIEATSNSVTVYIRGSVYNCDSPRTGKTYARKVTPVGYNAWRLTALSSTTLYRGKSEGAREWSTKGSQITATLNVSGIAPPKENEVSTGTISLSLDRCFSTSSTGTPTGICYPETLTIEVTRSPPPYDYELTPHTPSPLPKTIESSTTIPSISGQIDNSGPTKSRDDTIWQMTTYIGQPRDAAINGNAPCGDSTEGRYSGDNFGTSCESLKRGSGSIGTGGEAMTRNDIDIGELDVGDKVCFALSVRAATDSDDSWSHSASQCVVVSKKPKVQVIGSDLWVGRSSSLDHSVSTSISVITNPSPTKTYGSYVEYGLVASGSVAGMASGSGYAGGSSTSDLCQVSLLTFNNADDTSCAPNTVGGYTKLPSAGTAFSSRFPVSQSTPNMSGTVRLSDRSSGIYTLASGTLNLSSTSIAPGRWYVINAPNADVRITGDITYTSDVLGSVADIPQVVIISRNISINQSVSRVDAWLVASGTGQHGRLNTCRISSADETTLGAGLNATVCNTKLTVNGPVVANHLLLRRTAGAGPGNAAGDPAEVFNLRPDAYMWASYRASLSGQLKTVNTIELPPRY